MSENEWDKMVLVSFTLLKDIVQKANPDCLIQWRWPDKPTVAVVTFWEPIITVVRPDTPSA